MIGFFHIYPPLLDVVLKTETTVLWDSPCLLGTFYTIIGTAFKSEPEIIPHCPVRDLRLPQRKTAPRLGCCSAFS